MNRSNSSDLSYSVRLAQRRSLAPLLQSPRSVASIPHPEAGTAASGLDIGGAGRYSPSTQGQEFGHAPIRLRLNGHSRRVIHMWMHHGSRMVGQPPARLGRSTNDASVEDAEGRSRTYRRVETVGRKLIAQNTFTGIEPLFFTVGVPEAVLFHRGPEELIVSEGVVKQCKTDGELAAVLCSELAQMMNEKKSARRAAPIATRSPKLACRRVRAWPEARWTIPAAPRNGPFKSGTGNRMVRETRPIRRSLRRDLMRGAGYDPADLDRVAPLLKQSAPDWRSRSKWAARLRHRLGTGKSNSSLTPLDRELVERQRPRSR